MPEGSKAILMSVVMVIPVMLLFIIIGLLLFIYYQRPDTMASGQADGPVPTFAGEAVTIFMYCLTEILQGAWFVTIGIIATLSTLNSGLNSMSSVVIQISTGRGSSVKVAHGRTLCESWPRGDGSGRCHTRAMACLCYYWQQYTETPLLQFALSVMVFSYSGLLGVYFVTLFSKRGSSRSVTTALVVGFFVPLVMQPYTQQLLLPADWVTDIGFTWQLMIGTAISTLICLAGSQSNTAPTNQRKVSEA